MPCAARLIIVGKQAKYYRQICRSGAVSYYVAGLLLYSGFVIIGRGAVLMSFYPQWNPARVTATTYCTVGWANDLQNNLKSLVQDAFDTKGTKTTLRSFFRNTLSSLGIMANISHNSLNNITADQHHNRDHGDTHTDGTDDIPSVNITQRGIMTGGHAIKLDNIATGATENRFFAYYFMGTGILASQYINIGYRPSFIIVNHSLQNEWGEVIEGATFAFCHKGSTHTKPVASKYIKIGSQGFTVYTTMNCSTHATHYYFLLKKTS